MHFRTSYFKPSGLAHKSLHVNLSDIAAMGATPLFVLMDIAIPLSYEKYISEFLQAFTAICKNNSIVLIGGDTTKSSDKLSISITAIGTARVENIKYFNSAQPGGSLWREALSTYFHILESYNAV
ncbi:MAG: Thiamine monophosphate kinase [Candidatus Midichloria mitochondrii]|nr:AIR synthase related protein [Candidatus Midichloria mitochondrii]MDJ1256802.1 AIR synthase related protein [Candidatus Midichloria mitochondrii]MDJ1288535.1 AIR synthase related protein [Candidatus Midichloria mitochondrii]MDJ1299371.1 AIR synthase related protein [Candidatus Midichloria mitochondrii]MDJ1313488.1 AIR synthase related protein [Candidatus Midichloria mitochondrii]MDJ1584074.1 AIR synthase related protein [Candidatus Midichloria mitochondrii]